MNNYANPMQCLGELAETSQHESIERYRKYKNPTPTHSYESHYLAEDE